MALQIMHVQWAVQYPDLDYDWPRAEAFSAAPNTSDASAAPFLVSFTTLTPQGVTLRPTTDSWEGCGGVGDVMQVAVSATAPG